MHPFLLVLASNLVSAAGATCNSTGQCPAGQYCHRQLGFTGVLAGTCVAELPSTAMRCWDSQLRAWPGAYTSLPTHDCGAAYTSDIPSDGVLCGATLNSTLKVNLKLYTHRDSLHLMGLLVEAGSTSVLFDHCMDTCTPPSQPHCIMVPGMFDEGLTSKMGLALCLARVGPATITYELQSRACAFEVCVGEPLLTQNASLPEMQGSSCSNAAGSVTRIPDCSCQGISESSSTSSRSIDAAEGVISSAPASKPLLPLALVAMLVLG